MKKVHVDIISTDLINGVVLARVYPDTHKQDPSKYQPHTFPIYPSMTSKADVVRSIAKRAQNIAQTIEAKEAGPATTLNVGPADSAVFDLDDLNADTGIGGKKAAAAAPAPKTQ
jgi:hypothetical protein